MIDFASKSKSRRLAGRRSRRSRLRANMVHHPISKILVISHRFGLNYVLLSNQSTCHILCSLSAAIYQKFHIRMNLKKRWLDCTRKGVDVRWKES